MKTVYLHIGTFKTGTSSIQNFIAHNREALRDLGYFVPSSQLMGHHELPISLIRDYSDFEGVWPSFEGNSEQIWGRLIEEIDSCTCDKVIISAEGFCDLANENCRDVSEHMGSLVGDYLGKYKVVVICYVRELVPYMRSMYGETIKITTRTLSFQEQVHRYAENNSIHLLPSTYLDFFEKLFGRDAMVVKKYSRDDLVGGDVVRDFVATVGLGDEVDPLLDLREPVLQNLNISLGAKQLDLKRAFNLAGIQGLEINRQVTDVINSCAALARGDTSDEVAQELSELINAEQARLNDRYELNLAAPEQGIFSVDSEEARDSDYLYLFALQGLSIKQGRDVMQSSEALTRLVQQNSEALTRLVQQNSEALTRLAQQNEEALGHLRALRKGILRRGMSKAWRLLREFFGASGHR